MMSLQKTVSLFGCVSLLLLAGKVSSADNLLANPGFETGSLAPWFQDRDFGSGGEAWNATSADAHTGVFSATSDDNLEIRQNFAPTATSDITEVSFWAKHPDAGVTALFVDLFYSDASDTGFIVGTSGTDWNFFNVTSSLAAGKQLIGFSIFGNTGGRTYLDDAVVLTAGITDVPEPGSVAFLMGAGLAGAGLLRKRYTRR